MDVSKDIVKIFKDQNKTLLVQLSKEFKLNTKVIINKYHTPQYYMPVTHVSDGK